MQTGEGGWGLWVVVRGGGVLCVYSVQIIACFSAFSIGHHKKKTKNTEVQHSHTTTIKKIKITSVLSMSSGVENASYKLLGANCSGVM